MAQHVTVTERQVVLATFVIPVQDLKDSMAEDGVDPDLDDTEAILEYLAENGLGEWIRYQTHTRIPKAEMEITIEELSARAADPLLPEGLTMPADQTLDLDPALQALYSAAGNLECQLLDALGDRRDDPEWIEKLNIWLYERAQAALSDNDRTNDLEVLLWGCRVPEEILAEWRAYMQEEE